MFSFGWSEYRRLQLKCAALVAVLTMMFAASVGAEPVHPSFTPTTTFGDAGSGSPDALTAPSRVVVDDSRHDILVADTGSNRVAVYAADATSAAYQTEFGGGVLNGPVGLALDRVSHKVYVGDAGNARILRYTISGGATPTYTLDSSFLSPAIGSGAGQIGSADGPLAVDPTTHDLLVGDVANHRVNRYAQDGTFISSFDGTAGGQPHFGRPSDLAVGPTGIVYVMDLVGDPFTNGAYGSVRRFNAQGAQTGIEPDVGGPTALTVDPVSGMVVVVGNSAFGSPQTLYSFFDDDAAGQVDFPSAGQAQGVAIDPTAPQRLYAVGGLQLGGIGQVNVQVFTSVAAPGAAIGAPTSISSTSAHVTGTVTPGSSAVTPHFEYSGDGTSWFPLPDLAPVSGSSEQAVSDDVTGLDPNQAYQVRLVATDASASTTTRGRAFTTAPAPPIVVTGGAQGTSATTATLSGRVNALGSASSYHFDYGPTTAYGARAPISHDDVGDAKRVDRIVTEDLAGLTPGVTYHYRLVASNAGGSSTGADRTFILVASDTDGARGYEQLTPIAKGAAQLNVAAGFQAGAGGNGLLYTASSPFDLGGGAGPHNTRYLGQRESGTWSTTPLDVPQTPGTSVSVLNSTVLAASADLGKQLVVSNRALTANAVEGRGNIYIHDLSSGAFTLIAAGSRAFYEQVSGLSVDHVFYGAADDFSTVVLVTTEKLTPDGVAGVPCLYAWTDGHLALASVLPDGSAAPDGVYTDNSGVYRRYVSADGRRIFFSTRPGTVDGVYARSGGRTTALTVSQRAGDPPTPQPATLDGTSADGRYAFFTVTGSLPLTTDGTGTGSDKYRYDLGSGTMQFIAGGVGQDYSVSADGSADVFEQYLYGPLQLWRDGHLVDATAGISIAGQMNTVSLSANGEYAAIRTYVPLTADDNVNAAKCPDDFFSTYNGQCWEVYVLNADSGALSCASCPSSGAPPGGPVGLFSHDLNLGGRQVNTITDSGEVLFDTPTSLIPQDANGTADVYSYRAGSVRLISRATTATTSRFADMTLDGHDVFFTTDDRLVGQDTDNALDIYDARVGGGLDGQAGLSGRVPCQGADCAEPAPGPVGSPSTPSQSVHGDGAPAPSAPKAKIRLGRLSASRTAIHLRVTVSAPGTIRASGSGLHATSRSVVARGTYNLTVPLSAKSRAALRRHHRVHVRPRVSLTPPFGDRVIATSATHTIGK